MRVLAAHVLEPVSLLVEVAHRVTAQECEPEAIGEPVPENLEADRCVGLPVLPQHVHHLAVGANQRRLRSFDEEPPYEIPHRRLERVSARHIVPHELPKHLARIQHDQVATSPGLLYVEYPSLELVENRPAMRSSGDENGRLLVNETLTEKAGHGGVQSFLVVVELNGVMLMSFVHDCGVRFYVCRGLSGKHMTVFYRCARRRDTLL